jgi:hypothetical protein
MIRIPANHDVTMSDPGYPESAAYHEAGHVVVAAAQHMRLSRHGIHLDAEGRGISYYEYRKPKRWADITPEVTREHTIISTLAGLIAQQKFYPECSVLGASDDNNLVDEMLREVHEGEGVIGFACSTAEVELRLESEKLVHEHWPAIEAVARTLWETPETPRDFNEPDPGWSQLRMEKRLDGMRLLEILTKFGIQASIWDAKPLAD